jgi:hypothetical protein
VCEVDGNGNLKSIAERTKVYREGDKIVYEENEQKNELSADAKVSMNFWCFHPAVFGTIEKLFLDFLAKSAGNPKAEFFIPIIGDHLVRTGTGTIKIIPTGSQWFGVTYKEDAPEVKGSLEHLVHQGEYPPKLWN